MTEDKRKAHVGYYRLLKNIVAVWIVMLIVALLSFFLYNRQLVSAQRDQMMITNGLNQLNKEVVQFEDPYFESLIRFALDRDTGEIYVQELESVVSLRLNDSHEQLQYKEYNQPLNINDLKYFTNLETLTITGFKVEDADVIHHLTKLKTLDLKKNSIKDISFLSHLKAVEKVDLSFNKIRFIPDNIERANNLKELILLTNKIRDASNLFELPKLELLDLTDNYMDEMNIENINYSLKELLLRNNIFEEFGFNQTLYLPQLEVLDLSFTNISRIEGLEILDNLEELYLEGFGYFNLSVLEDMESFNSIYLSPNFNRSQLDFLIGNFKEGDPYTKRHLVGEYNDLQY